jgi:hypothetical protein
LFIGISRSPQHILTDHPLAAPFARKSTCLARNKTSGMPRAPKWRAPDNENPEQVFFPHFAAAVPFPSVCPLPPPPNPPNPQRRFFCAGSPLAVSALPFRPKGEGGGEGRETDGDSGAESEGSEAAGARAAIIQV